LLARDATSKDRSSSAGAGTCKQEPYRHACRCVNDYLCRSCQNRAFNKTILSVLYHAWLDVLLGIGALRSFALYECAYRRRIVSAPCIFPCLERDMTDFTLASSTIRATQTLIALGLWFVQLSHRCTSCRKAAPPHALKPPQNQARNSTSLCLSRPAACYTLSEAL
jgi:hypothetical protein